ncbi:MAG: ferrochelatase, partial [Bdellovibrionales bacterium]|nr:ferrochelatase [Bdellovibrionales bacterium]
LEESIGSPVFVELGMSYGEPSLEQAIDSLRERGARKLLVLPLYPQYSGTTTGSVFDGVVNELKKLRWVPEFRMITSYHDHPGYIKALADRVRTSWAEHGRGQKLLMSFHGIPQRYFDGGDPYHCHCHKTARLVAEELGLSRDQYIVSFQSLFGREEWIKPYTDKTMERLPKNGCTELDVMCPGFIADCLETLEEIGEQNRDIFLEHGGSKYSYVPCLNDSPSLIALLHDLVLSHTAGWVVPQAEWDPAAAQALAGETQKRFEECEPKTASGEIASSTA